MSHLLNDTIYFNMNGNIGINTSVANASLDLSNKMDAILLPTGTTIQRPSLSNHIMRYNIDHNNIEFSLDNNWFNFGVVPQINSVSTAILKNIDDTIIVSGSNFTSDAIWTFLDASGNMYSPKDVIYTSISSVTITRPDIMPPEKAPYTLKVKQYGRYNTYKPISAGIYPTILTPGGSLGVFNEETNITSIDISANDESGGGIVSMTITSGYFPPGLTTTFTSSGYNGIFTISGLTNDISSTTVYTFTLLVTDAGNNTISQQYSLTINHVPLAITSSPPTNINQSTTDSRFDISYNFTSNKNVIWSINSTDYATIDASTGRVDISFNQNTTASGTFIVTATKNLESVTRSWTFNITDIIPDPISGGTYVDASGYRIRTFTSSSTLIVSTTTTVDFLLIAGGGGGGSTTDRTAGGGGAGGVIYQTGIAISANSYSITLGGGGGNNNSGSNSVFSTYTATGGGRGGGHPSTTAGNGGSGGGRYHNPAGRAGTGTSGQGFNGGPNGYDSGTSVFTASGGGGAGAIGNNATTTAGGSGGSGRQISITGTAVYYAGGGGGSAQSLSGQNYPAGAGGLGGGGAGAVNSNNSTANGGGGATYYGSGGGGGGGYNGGGGSGYQGIFIIRYAYTGAPPPVITSMQPASMKIDNNDIFSISYNFKANRTVTWSIIPTTYGNISSNGDLSLTFPQYIDASGTFVVTATSVGGTATQSWTYTTSIYPANYWVILDASAITQANGTSVSAWGQGISFTGYNSPTYYSTGGYHNRQYVYFNRANSSYLNANTRTLNISTNGGFTSVCLIKFTGAVGAWERIHDFGNNAYDMNLAFNRLNATQNFGLDIYNSDSTDYVNSANNEIVQEEWMVLAVRYIKQSKIQAYKNNVMLVDKNITTDFTDRTITNTYIGRSNFSGNAYLNAHISKLFIYDRALSDVEMTRLYNFITVPIITSTQPENITTDTSSNAFTITYNFATDRTVTWSITPTTYTDLSSNTGALRLTFPQYTYVFGTYTITATGKGGTASQSWTYNIKNGDITGLYTFTTHTFTNATATGRNGPTLTNIQTSYSSQSWASNTAFINIVTQGIQEWSVPTTSFYTFEIAGAASGSNGGTGNIISGIVDLSMNDKLYIVVGQLGVVSGGNSGGGGGTFIYRNALSINNIILAAGGGGGNNASWSEPFNSNINANTGTNGFSGQGGTAGGGGGGGFPGGGGTMSGRSGANGNNGSGGDHGGSQSGGGGGGGAGRTSSATFIGGNRVAGYDGGFGGGGSTSSVGGCGGGGGYGGGGAGGEALVGSKNVGGGGGSFGATVVISYNNNVGTNTNHGYVTITKL